VIQFRDLDETILKTELRLVREFGRLFDSRVYLHRKSNQGDFVAMHLFEDEFLILRYKASNEPPYPFQWVDFGAVTRDYASVLTRISSKYQRRA
jgi:hypothetical protein